MRRDVAQEGGVLQPVASRAAQREHHDAVTIEHVGDRKHRRHGPIAQSAAGGELLAVETTSTTSDEWRHTVNKLSLDVLVVEKEQPEYNRNRRLSAIDLSRGPRSGTDKEKVLLV